MITTIARIAAAAAATTLVIGSAIGAASAAEPSRPPEPANAKVAVRYCVKDEIGGSRFTKRTCKTRDAWVQDENFDPVVFMAARKK